jgi:hypothetical protein
MRKAVMGVVVAGLVLVLWIPSATAQTFATSGSGFLVDSAGYILTNYHVVEGATGPITVTLSDGRKYEAEVVDYSATFEDGGFDAALLKIHGTGFPTLPLADSEGVQLFDRVMVLGYPLSFSLGVSLNITGGNVTAFRDLEGGPRVFQIDAVVNPGNSGGPALDDYGRVIGIVTSKFEGEAIEGIGFVVPINAALALVSQHVSGGAFAAPAGVALTSRQIVSAATPAIVYIEWSDVYVSGGTYEETFSEERDWYAEYWNGKGYIEIPQNEEAMVLSADCPAKADGPFFEIDVLFTECVNDNCGAGIEFRALGEAAWSYLVLISTDGWYALFSMSPSGSTWKTVAPWRQSNNLKTGLNVVNHIQIEVRDNITVVSFNRAKPGSLNAVLPLGGTVGLCVVSWEGRTSARFDNLKIYATQGGSDMTGP